MQAGEEVANVSEVVVLILALATPVLTAFCIGMLFYFRRNEGKSWFRSAMLAIASTFFAFVATFGIWVALGHAPFDLPEPLFMVMGFINSPAVLACIIVFVVVVLVRSRSNGKAAAV